MLRYLLFCLLLLASSAAAQNTMQCYGSSPSDGDICAYDGVTDNRWEWTAFSSLDTNANTQCSGSTTYLDGEGNCDTATTIAGAINLSDLNSASHSDLSDFTAWTDSDCSDACSGYCCVGSVGTGTLNSLVLDTYHFKPNANTTCVWATTTTAGSTSSGTLTYITHNIPVGAVSLAGTRRLRIPYALRYNSAWETGMLQLTDGASSIRLYRDALAAFGDGIAMELYYAFCYYSD